MRAVISRRNSMLHVGSHLFSDRPLITLFKLLRRLTGYIGRLETDSRNAQAHQLPFTGIHSYQRAGRFKKESNPLKIYCIRLPTMDSNFRFYERPYMSSRYHSVSRHSQRLGFAICSSYNPQSTPLG